MTNPINIYNMETPQEAALKREVEMLRAENGSLKRQLNGSFPDCVGIETPIENATVVNSIDMHLAVKATMNVENGMFHMMAKEYRDIYPLKVAYYVSDKGLFNAYRPELIFIELHKQLIGQFIKMEGIRRTMNL